MWTFLQLLGASLVVAGVSVIFWPAGMILAGAAIAAVGFLAEPPRAS